jgi:hypothetical protein
MLLFLLLLPPPLGAEDITNDVNLRIISYRFTVAGRRS